MGLARAWQPLALTGVDDSSLLRSTADGIIRQARRAVNLLREVLESEWASDTVVP